MYNYTYVLYIYIHMWCIYRSLYIYTDLCILYTYIVNEFMMLCNNTHIYYIHISIYIYYFLYIYIYICVIHIARANVDRYLLTKLDLYMMPLLLAACRSCVLCVCVVVCVGVNGVICVVVLCCCCCCRCITC